MSSFSFRPYVSVAERRRQAEKVAKKLAKEGKPTEPVVIEGRNIATTFWGQAWCNNLESYSDFANRLPRGRTYARNGSVIDLKILPGKITGLVQGSALYKISIDISPLPPDVWKKFVEAATGQVTNLLDLLQGKLPNNLLSAITNHKQGLFPSPKEIKLGCSCPDWASLCKHLAAVLYGVGARLDTRPELFFTLRGVDIQELITAAGETASAPISTASTSLEGEDLSALFGVDIESEPESPPPATSTQVKEPAKKPAKPKAVKPVKASPSKPKKPVRSEVQKVSKKGGGAKGKKPAESKPAPKRKPKI